MKSSDHDAATVRAIAIYQKIVVAFILLDIVAIVFGLALPDDLRPMLQYLMMPMALIAGVFLFLLVIKVFGVRVGAVLIVLDLLLIGGAFYREWPLLAEPPTPRQTAETLGDDEVAELIKLLQQRGLDDPDANPVPDPVKTEKSREEQARLRKEKFANAFDNPAPPRSGPRLIWVVFANLALVLVVNLRANAILRAHRISTGLLGADLADFVRQEPKAAP